MRTLGLFLALTTAIGAAEPADTAKAFSDFADRELANDPAKTGKFSDEFSKRVRTRLTDANNADREAWAKITTKQEWEAFRDARIQAMRQTIGTFPDAPKELTIRVTKTIDGDGYRIDNCLYESRPGLWVTGNLYKPAKPGASCPAFLICHSHHNPKHEGELQDMGVLWAKLGCYVLVIDQLGHGERRTHPFTDAKAFPEMFRVGRQDYYFRYNTGVQLALAGESLIGWMAWDMMRGVDLLLKQPNVAQDKVILLGAVAGGGDPVGVTAALDPRINCVCPFNFGGPQPETRYPLPDNAEEWFNYTGSGSWESTRNIRGSVRGGYLPWAIVASVAPRKLIHAHEFSWDQERDPVWKRYQKIYGWYGATDNLAFAHGRGVIVGNDPNASHCNNIGVIHRQLIYAALKKWYGIPVPEKEIRDRHTADELRCWTPDAIKELKPQPLHAVLQALADQRLAVAREKMTEAVLLERMQASLGVVWTKRTNETIVRKNLDQFPASISATQITLAGDRPSVSALLLAPKEKKGERFPVIVVVSQEGYARVLKERSEAFARLLQQRCALVLVNVRGTGPERPGDGRGRSSGATSLTASVQMLGETTLGQRTADLCAILDRLRFFESFDAERIALWGESLAAPNDAGTVLAVPYDVSKSPKLAEPMAATIVGLAALQRPAVKAVLARGGLVNYRSVYHSPFVYVPHDALPVRQFHAGDLPDLWGASSSRVVRLEGLVNGYNQRETQESLDTVFRPWQKQAKLTVYADYSNDAALADWLVGQFK